MSSLGEEPSGITGHQEGRFDAIAQTIDAGFRAAAARGITARNALLALWGTLAFAVWYDQFTQVHAEPRVVERLIGDATCGDKSVFCDPDAEDPTNTGQVADVSALPSSAGTTTTPIGIAQKVQPAATKNTVCEFPSNPWYEAVTMQTLPNYGARVTEICGLPLSEPIGFPVNKNEHVEVRLTGVPGSSVAYVIALFHNTASAVLTQNGQIESSVACIEIRPNACAEDKARPFTFDTIRTVNPASIRNTPTATPSFVFEPMPNSAATTPGPSPSTKPAPASVNNTAESTRT